MSNILLIEDEEGIQLTLQDRLEQEGYIIDISADGISGAQKALQNDYDLILLDLMLPGQDGYAVCEAIRKAGKTVPILMLTARNTNLDIVLGLRTGADDYLAKPFDMQVLLARIAALLRRSIQSNKKKAEAESTFHFGDYTLDVKKGLLLKEKDSIPLNAQEYRLLVYFNQHINAIISRDTLLDEVWGYDSDITSRTVDVHIAKLRQKLGESDIPRHIRTIRGRGYKFVE